MAGEPCKRESSGSSIFSISCVESVKANRQRSQFWQQRQVLCHSYGTALCVCSPSHFYGKRVFHEETSSGLPVASPHSLKLFLSESPVLVPLGTTRCAALSRGGSKQHHAHRLAPSKLIGVAFEFIDMAPHGSAMQSMYSHLPLYGGYKLF